MERLTLTLLVMTTLAGACAPPPEEPPYVPEDDAGTPSVPLEDAGPPPSTTAPVRVTSYCVRSSCTGCTERQQIAIDGCYDCIDFCGMNPPSSTCISTCQGICARANAMTCAAECSAPVCYESNVSFSLVGESDEVVRAACLSGNANCDAAGIEMLCDIASKVEPRAVLETYRCLATEACTAEAATKCVPASRGTLRTWYCAALASYGGSCDGGDVARRLDGIEPWLRADVMASVRACESEVGTTDFEACLTRWLRTVGG